MGPRPEEQESEFRRRSKARSSSPPTPRVESVGGPTWIDAVADRFEREWNAGSKPRIEDFLADVPEAVRASLLGELVRVEWEIRAKNGEKPTREEYQRRFADNLAIKGIVHRAARSKPLAPAQRPPAPAGEIGETVAALSESGEKSPLQAAAIQDPAAETNLKGRMFGQYELQEKIAQGGMGIVFKARQVGLNRIVALKMILSGQLSNPEDVRRFYHEAEATAKLDHPGIVPVYDVGQCQGRHYYSMGFVLGETLAKRAARGRLTQAEAASLVKQIAEAVQYAHERGVIHRDLNPSNVMIDEQGHPKIVDFGLARVIAFDSSLSISGQVMGTPSYMPPEQANGDRDLIGPAADVYALGGILYFLLTGRPPLQAATLMDTLRLVLDKDPILVRKVNPTADRDLETICHKCLQKPIPLRYATAASVAADLGNWLDHKPISARPVSATQQLWRWCQRNQKLAASISAAAIGLLATTIVFCLFLLERQATSGLRVGIETQVAQTKAARSKQVAACEEPCRRRGTRRAGHTQAARFGQGARRQGRTGQGRTRPRIPPGRQPGSGTGMERLRTR